MRRVRCPRCFRRFHEPFKGTEAELAREKWRWLVDDGPYQICPRCGYGFYIEEFIFPVIGIVSAAGLYWVLGWLSGAGGLVAGSTSPLSTTLGILSGSTAAMAGGGGDVTLLFTMTGLFCFGFCAMAYYGGRGVIRLYRALVQRT